MQNNVVVFIMYHISHYEQVTWVIHFMLPSHYLPFMYIFKTMEND